MELWGPVDMEDMEAMEGTVADMVVMAEATVATEAMVASEEDTDHILAWDRECMAGTEVMEEVTEEDMDL